MVDYAGRLAVELSLLVASIVLLVGVALSLLVVATPLCRSLLHTTTDTGYIGKLKSKVKMGLEDLVKRIDGIKFSGFCKPALDVIHVCGEYLGGAQLSTGVHRHVGMANRVREM